MTRQLIEHMIEETNPGCNIGKARPIEVEADLDARLIRLAYDCALAHGDFLCLKPLSAAVIASHAPIGHRSFDKTAPSGIARGFAIRRHSISKSANAVRWKIRRAATGISEHEYETDKIR